jgi:hypothetical protein
MSTTISPERKARLAAIADAHLEWSRAIEWPADDGKLQDHGNDSDYGQHHLDVDPPAGAEERFHSLIIQHDTAAVEKAFRRQVQLNGQETWEDIPDAVKPAAGGGAMEMPPVPGGVPGFTAGGEPPRWDGGQPEPRVMAAPDDADDAKWPQGRAVSERPHSFPTGPQSMDGYWPAGQPQKQPETSQPVGGARGVPPSTLREKPSAGKVGKQVRKPVPESVGKTVASLESGVAKVGPHGYVHGWIKVDPSADRTYVDHRAALLAATRDVQAGQEKRWVTGHDGGYTVTSTRPENGGTLVQHDSKGITKPFNDSGVGELAEDRENELTVSMGVDHLKPPGTDDTYDAAVDDYRQNASHLLSGDEKRAAFAYGTNAGTRLNEKMAAGEPLGKRQQKLAAALDTAISRYQLPHAITVNRNADEAASLKPGDVHTHAPFLSTSFDDWNKPAGRKYGRTKLSLTVPAGTSALNMNALGGEFSSEHELLLPRGSSYRVDSTTDTSNGLHIVNATLLPANAAAVTKVGPHGYIHGWVKVLPDDELAAMAARPVNANDDVYNSVPKLADIKTTAEAKQAVSDYTDGSVADGVNRTLRLGAPDESGLPEYKRTNAKTAATIANMDQAFHDAPPLEHPVTVFRGVMDVREMFGDVGERVGGEFDDKAFTSTSTSPQVADWFARASQQDKAVLTIHVPAGAKAVNPDKMGMFGDMAREVVLNRGGRYRVLSDKVVPSQSLGWNSLNSGNFTQADIRHIQLEMVD